MKGSRCCDRERWAHCKVPSSQSFLTSPPPSRRKHHHGARSFGSLLCWYLLERSMTWEVASRIFFTITVFQEGGLRFSLSEKSLYGLFSAAVKNPVRLEGVRSVGSSNYWFHPPVARNITGLFLLLPASVAILGPRDKSSPRGVPKCLLDTPLRRTCTSAHGRAGVPPAMGFLE